MKMLLLKYEEVLNTLQANILSLLQNGLPKEEIKKKLLIAGIPAIEELVNLYEWKNGVDDSIESFHEAELFPEGIMLSLESSLESYRIYTQKKIWNRELFPLFTNGSGDFILMNIMEGDYSLFMYAPSLLLSDTPFSIYDSLDKMFATLIACFEQGAYYVKEDKLMELDFDLKYTVSETLNPLSEFWKL
jgi:hypothetical protein